MENKNKLIKSPMNNMGSKYRLLPQILPLFPKEIDTFVDLFCGGFNVGVNVDANKIIGNDLCKEIIELFQGIQREGSENSLSLVKSQINKFGLSKTNEEGFKEIRKFYNDGNKEWYIFYALFTNAFNYQIRFNKKGEFNMPFGRNAAWFNPKLENNFINFANVISDKKFEFTNISFEDFNLDNLTKNDFVYLDPPYLLSNACYNESRGGTDGGWTEEKEYKLLALCDKLNEKGIKFALSNVLEHKGLKNEILQEWGKKYNINYLDCCSYRHKNKDKKTIEVLIINY